MNNYVHAPKFYMHIYHALNAEILLKFKHSAGKNMQKNLQRINTEKTCMFSLSSRSVIEILSTKLIVVDSSYHFPFFFHFLFVFCLFSLFFFFFGLSLIYSSGLNASDVPGCFMDCTPMQKSLENWDPWYIMQSKVLLMLNSTRHCAVLMTENHLFFFDNCCCSYHSMFLSQQ